METALTVLGIVVMFGGTYFINKWFPNATAKASKPVMKTDKDEYYNR